MIRQKGDRVSNLLKEIREQPAVLERLLSEGWPTVQQIADLIRARDVQSVLIAARGTSDNAATYGKYLLGSYNQLPVALAAPSLYTLYNRPPTVRNALVLGISQSGASPDVCSVVSTSREQGALTVALTNDAGSALAETAECVIDLMAGPERSVAATKTYTAELMALALLSVALAGDSGRLEQLSAVPGAVRETLALAEEGTTGALRYRYMPDCVVVGRGYNYATALEIALKLKELTYVGASPYSSADFRHGPVAVVDRGFPVVLVAPSGAVHSDLMDLMSDLEAREAELVVISDQEETLNRAHTSLRLPTGLPEWVSPLVAVIPGQLLGYNLALVKGLDPEHPRGLRKVTETR